jgi:hypothetical protein
VYEFNKKASGNNGKMGKIHCKKDPFKLPMICSSLRASFLNLALNRAGVLPP